MEKEKIEKDAKEHIEDSLQITIGQQL